jgi:actin-related protein
MSARLPARVASSALLRSSACLPAQKFKLHIEDPPRRKNLVFQGASVLGKIMEKRPGDFWVTKAKYDELGAERAAKLLSKDM